VNLGFLLIIVIMIGTMFLMTRSAKNKQRQAQEMRNQMEPGVGIRTIGGIYAIVKEVQDEAVLVEVADGVHMHFAKNAIATVLDGAEYDRIVHGITPEDPEIADGDADGAGDAADDTTGTEDGTEDAAPAADAKGADTDDERIDLTKSDEHPENAPETGGGGDSK
jgi:preprotein translocase subunit YajC